LLRTAQASFGERPALSIHAGLREDSWSYNRLWDGANAVARYLNSESGLVTGSRIAVWGPNCPQLVAAYFGIMLAGMVLVPIDPLSTDAFVSRVLKKTDASVVILGFPGRSPTQPRVLPLFDLPFDAPGQPVVEMPAADDIAEVVFTSGTTGSPKGVILTHRNIVASVLSSGRLVPTRPYRLLSILPLSHMLEQTVGLYVPLLFGGTVHYSTSRQPRVLTAAMRRYRVTTLVLVPQVLELMVRGIENEVGLRGRDRLWRLAHRIAPYLPLRVRRALFRKILRELGGQLDFVICGGAKLAEELMMTWERMGIRVIEGYGTTECAPLVAGNSYASRMPGSVGRPAPGVRVRLSDDGEILVKGANVTPGHWRDPTATTAAFDAGHWYRTGDLGSWDETGHLYLTGRLKDLIVLPNGLNVHPEDVEHELLREPDIGDCVVVSLPDVSRKASVHAVVIPSWSDSNDVSQRERITAAVRAAGARLAPHQHVTGITIWEGNDFPRTNLGKVKRYEVIEAVAGRARQPDAAPAATSGDPRLDQVRSLLVKVTGLTPSAITPAADLESDLNLDSLARVELAVALEADLGATLEDGDLAKVRTVEELIELLDNTRAAPTEARFPTWPRRPWAVAARHFLQRAIVFPVHSLIARPFTVEGKENLQSLEAPLLLIANHTSHMDTPSILRALPPSHRQRTAVAAAADYFYGRKGRGAAMSLLLNTFPFSRKGAVRSSLEYCGDLVDAGWSVLIYPEGTRSITGILAPFRSGIGLLAQQLRVPVVPIGVTGAHDVLPKGSSRPYPGTLRVRIGQPISPTLDANRTKLVETLEHSVAELLAAPTAQVPA